MATAINRFNPTFSLFPIQNNRTAWKPVYLPVVLVVPARRDAGGNDIPTSDVDNVQYLIENAPERSKVAGFKNQGILVPKLERFSVHLDKLALQQYIVDLKGQVFIDQDTGAEKDYEDARSGDEFYLTLENGDARDKIIYYPDADYYDLSPVTITTVELKPYGIYNFVWQATYQERILTQDDELFCVGDNQKLTRFAVAMNHPGDVHRAMVENTPSAYFEGGSLDEDGTVDFYRPFADVLQDIFDEQSFIQGINWVTKIPAQYIPYLGYLIGWDPPYFGNIDDNVRLSFIRNARKLQKLKGAKRAIWELFEIFGFTIDIVNLWYRSDGKDFIGPYDPIQKGFENDYVTLEEVCSTEPVISDNGDSGFGDIAIPLIHRPVEDLTVEAWLVSDDGQSRTDLLNVVKNSISNPNSLDQELCNSTADGILISDAFDNVDMATVKGHAKVAINLETGLGTSDYYIGEPPINQNSITYDKDTNQLRIIYDKYLDLSNTRLFVFAIYHRDKITPSQSLQDLRSNRFDIRVLLFKDGEQPDSDLYDFLLDFLFKIKAFHSLLRKVSFSVQYTDVYNVLDFCIGGLNKQAVGLDAGELQVPPAILPSDPTCISDQADRGFKDSDLKLREAIMDGLEAEHTSWKGLDNTHHVPANLRPIINSLSRIPVPNPEQPPCEWTQRGQDRVLNDPNVDFDHNPDNRTKLCSLEGNTKDYCYKGRTEDRLTTENNVLLKESFRCAPCSLMLGEGLYWSSPISSALNRWKDLNNFDESWSDRNFVRRAYWNDPLHFTNRSLIDPNENNDGLLAIRKPSLNIMKDNLFFPGHRFLQMYGLLDDFVHPTYGFRPWDDLLNLPCPEDVPVENGQQVPIPNLNTQIIVDAEGNEWLDFDFVQLTYYGNGLSPDIANLNDHAVGTDSDITSSEITHSIYTTAQPLLGSDGEFFEYDAMEVTEETDICTDDPIFNSANRNCDCGTDAANDYIDGYPAETGWFDFDGSRGFIGDDMSRTTWGDLLGIPYGGTEAPDNLLFKVGSGIRSPNHEFSPFRIDCGCLKFSCDTNATIDDNTIDACNLQYFYRQNGDLDFDCDKTDIFRTMILAEDISTCSYRLNGEISSLFLVDENKITWDNSGDVPVGSFRMKDEYGTILAASFKTAGDTLDITWTSFEPRVWGESDQGYVDGLKVFKKGIITVQRQILKTSNGQIAVIGEWQQQSTGYMQVNVTCGMTAYLDPFLFHTDCAILDNVEIDILCGPRWADPALSQDNSGWPDIGVDSHGNIFIGPVSGELPMQWINMWANDEELISDCQGS